MPNKGHAASSAENIATVGGVFLKKKFWGKLRVSAFQKKGRARKDRNKKAPGHRVQWKRHA